MPSKRANLWLAAVLSTLALSAILLALYPPSNSKLYPACAFQALTGLLCPGCGATRAIAALLHGHILEALRFNLLVVAAILSLAFWSAIAYTRAIRGRSPAWPVLPHAISFSAVVFTFCFAILRNIL